MSEMSSDIERGLIIRKEWLDRIFDKGKVWEMRSRPTNVRGMIGLIEAGSGLIIGEAELIDCLSPLDELDVDLKTIRYMLLHQVDDLDKLKKWKYPWVLKNAKRYNHPIPYDHPGGAVIWVKLDGLVAA